MSLLSVLTCSCRSLFSLTKLQFCIVRISFWLINELSWLALYSYTSNNWAFSFSICASRWSETSVGYWIVVLLVPSNISSVNRKTRPLRLLGALGGSGFLINSSYYTIYYWPTSSEISSSRSIYRISSWWLRLVLPSVSMPESRLVSRMPGGRKKNCSYSCLISFSTSGDGTDSRLEVPSKLFSSSSTNICNLKGFM